MWSLQERKCPAISEAAGIAGRVKLEGGGLDKTWEKWRWPNTDTPPAYGMEEFVGGAKKSEWKREACRWEGSEYVDELIWKLEVTLFCGYIAN